MLPAIDVRLIFSGANAVISFVKVKIVVPPENKYSVWTGGNISLLLSTF